MDRHHFRKRVSVHWRIVGLLLDREGCLRVSRKRSQRFTLILKYTSMITQTQTLMRFRRDLVREATARWDTKTDKIVL